LLARASFDASNGWRAAGGATHIT